VPEHDTSDVGSFVTGGGHSGRHGIKARLGPFRHTTFSVYWTGGFLSNIGTWVQTVAASVFVYQLTGSSLAVGILNFASFLPIFLFSIPGGMISDRFDRRLVVVVAHVVSGIVAAILAVLAFAGVAAEIHVVVIAFALNTSYALAKPALVSILPSLVPRDELTEAVGVNTLQFVTGQMIGPVVSAVVIGTAGVPWAFAINALSYFAPVLSMVYLSRHGLGEGEPGATSRRRAPSEARISSVGYVAEHRWVLALLLGIIACSAPLEVLRTLSPGLADALHEPDSAAGFIVAAQSAGSALALLAFVPLRRSGRANDVARIGLVIQAVGLVGAFAAGSLWVAALSVGLVGFGFSLCFPVLTSGLQAEVPDAVRGRIMGFHQMAHLGNRPFAALAAGAAAAMAGVQPAILIGLVLTPLGLFATRRAWDALRRPVSQLVAPGG
jgi:MFS family permease